MTELDTRQFIIERKQVLRTKLEEAQRAVDSAKEALTILEREFKALEALERQLTPKARGSRKPRGAIRQNIVRALTEKPQGLTAPELMEALGISGDEQGRISVKNALYAMTKAKGGEHPSVTQTNDRYVLQPAAQSTVAAPSSVRPTL
jgi:hypothetical protein